MAENKLVDLSFEFAVVIVNLVDSINVAKSAYINFFIRNFLERSIKNIFIAVAGLTCLAIFVARGLEATLHRALRDGNLGCSVAVNIRKVSHNLEMCVIYLKSCVANSTRYTLQLRHVWPPSLS